ncbi:Os05g0364300 [Oryza sativa Japonica Group]|uniref:Os05g0364300 protein n=1 Tax=Oryza sativa subsp. japonica TaxID=39947 RepID=Q688H8_ORYSJ|nr:unknown protein [Oryza sativa Japonica Group]AAV32232.1 unknown protein [Oryza sativa Japonica Group]BAH93114.1 Os05g0364300 [Oryza sativa Japonica Group]|eukprot:NP_001174386.1 Os05g0364300 [Oryza sativa Japonica Group]
MGGHRREGCHRHHGRSAREVRSPLGGAPREVVAGGSTL